MVTMIPTINIYHMISFVWCGIVQQSQSRSSKPQPHTLGRVSNTSDQSICPIFGRRLRIGWPEWMNANRVPALFVYLADGQQRWRFPTDSSLNANPKAKVFSSRQRKINAKRIRTNRKSFVCFFLSSCFVCCFAVLAGVVSPTMATFKICWGHTRCGDTRIYDLHVSVRVILIFR